MLLKIVSIHCQQWTGGETWECVVYTLSMGCMVRVAMECHVLTDIIPFSVKYAHPSNSTQSSR